jgi:hypothetical protein
MKVRDRTWESRTTKGKWVDAEDEVCPCRPCWNITSPGECVIKKNHGCPDPKPEPDHMFSLKTISIKTESIKHRKCVRCGAKVTGK